MNGFVKKPNKKKFNLKACKKNKLNYKLLKPNLIQTHLKIQKKLIFIGIRFLNIDAKESTLTEPNQFSLNWFSVWSGSYSLKVIHLDSVGFFNPNQIGLDRRHP
jgi:hypothetical protein